jgi:hypothetical protein
MPTGTTKEKAQGGAVLTAKLNGEWERVLWGEHERWLMWGRAHGHGGCGSSRLMQGRVGMATWSTGGSEEWRMWDTLSEREWGRLVRETGRERWWWGALQGCWFGYSVGKGQAKIQPEICNTTWPLAAPAQDGLLLVFFLIRRRARYLCIIEEKGLYTLPTHVGTIDELVYIVI